MCLCLHLYLYLNLYLYLCLYFNLYLFLLFLPVFVSVFVSLFVTVLVFVSVFQVAIFSASVALGAEECKLLDWVSERQGWHSVLAIGRAHIVQITNSRNKEANKLNSKHIVQINIRFDKMVQIDTAFVRGNY